jgi:hypothetical protein
VGRQKKVRALPDLLPRVHLHLALQVIAGSEALRSCIALHLSFTPTFTSRYFTPDQLQKRRPFLNTISHLPLQKIDKPAHDARVLLF